jgi:hypothetical protein
MPITIRIDMSEPFTTWVQRNREVAERAVQAGVAAATRAAQIQMRQQASAAGLGDRLPNAIRSDVWPKREASFGAAGSIYANGRRADEILSAFAQGALIRSKAGFFLAIPTAEAGRGPRGKRITPGLWERQHGQRLRFVYRRGAPSLLVAERRARTGRRGGFAEPSGRTRRTGTGLTTVVMFVLVSQVQLRKLLSPDRIVAQWTDRIPGLIERALPTDI